MQQPKTKPLLIMTFFRSRIRFFLVHLGGLDTITQASIWLIIPMYCCNLRFLSRRLSAHVLYILQVASVTLCSQNQIRGQTLTTRKKMPDRVVKADNRFREHKLTDLEVLQYAYRYFKTYDGLGY